MYGFCGTNVKNCSKIAKSTNFQAYSRSRLPLNQGQEARPQTDLEIFLHTTAQLADGADTKWPTLQKTPPRPNSEAGGGGYMGGIRAEQFKALVLLYNTASFR
jgi:hypothetical protein